MDWKNRAHFFWRGGAPHAAHSGGPRRKHRAEKHGGGKRPVRLEERETGHNLENSEGIIAVHEALEKLNNY